MLSEHESFIEAILDDPDNTLKRLVYADWLEEQGDYIDGIRARIIRLEAEQEKYTTQEPEHGEIQKEIDPILDRYGWLLKPNVPPGFSSRTNTHCIMVFRADVTVPRFLDWGTDYLRGLPPYCRIDLNLSRRPATGSMLKLLDSPAWPRVLAWSDRGDYEWTQKEFAAFITDERMNRLQELFFVPQHFDRMLGPESFTELVETPHLRRLQELSYYLGQVDQEHLQQLHDPKVLPTLKSLRFIKGKTPDRIIKELQAARPGVRIEPTR
jgi:uncharacterized protein (TIGR02996 family)